MKKLFALILALVLCVSAAAFAETPSKNTADLNNTITTPVTEENKKTVVEDKKAIWTEVIDSHLAQNYQEQLTLLAKADIAVSYFTNVALKELLNAEDEKELNVNEFCALFAKNYTVEDGAARVEFTFATPYEKGQQIVVLVGIINGDTVEWTAFDATVVEGSNGSISVVFPMETILEIQKNKALIAVVSK